MKKFVAAAFLLLLSTPAFADQGTQLVGQWIEQGTTGSMVLEFTGSTMSFTPVDGTGQPLKAPQISRVTYGGSGNVVNILVPLQGSFTAIVTDPNTLTLDVPGLPETQYRRIRR